MGGLTQLLYVVTRPEECELNPQRLDFNYYESPRMFRNFPKMSTCEIIRVPKLAARTRIPERIVQQRTLHRSLSACWASVRKSISFSGQEFQAFDDLAKLPDKLASSRVSIQFGIGESNSMGQLRRSYTITT